MTNIDPSTAQRQADFIEELEEKLAELKSQPVPDPSSASAVSEQEQIVQLMVRIPKRMHRDLKTICASRERSITEVLTDLICDWINENEIRR